MNEVIETNDVVKACCACEKECNSLPCEVVRSVCSKGNRFSVWRIACETNDGGCGRVVLGESQENVIRRWNQMETDSWITKPIG